MPSCLDYLNAIVEGTLPVDPRLEQNLAALRRMGMAEQTEDSAWHLTPHGERVRAGDEERLKH